MLDFKNQSFEKIELKTGKSGKEYDISYDGLYGVSNETLDDLIKEELDISEDFFAIISKEIKDVYYEDYKKEYSEEKVHGLSKESLEDILSNTVYNLNGLDQLTREDLREELNKQLLKTHSIENFDFFGVKDPRKVNLSIEKKEFYTEQKFPKNIINLLTHGTFYIPQEIRGKVKSEIKEILELSNDLTPDNLKLELKKKNAEFLRILKHFSDFGTRYVVKHSFIPKKQVIEATNSRSITDPARELGTKIMEKDFYDNKLPKALSQGIEIGSIKQEAFHLDIKKKTYETINREGGAIFIDNHDTGIVDMGESENLDRYDDGGFALINLGTKDGASCNSEIVEYYARRIEFHLGIKPLINKPYKGGYVTQRHGVEKREELEKQGKKSGIMNVIQQEVGKFLYLDERTQKVDKDKAELIGIGLARVQADLGRKFGKEYFKAVNKGEEAINNYLANYKESI